MNKLDFYYLNNHISLLLDRVKYCYFEDIKDYWTILQSVRFYTNKSTISNYGKNNSSQPIIKIDDSNISKQDELLIIDDRFSLEEEYKLGTKSLLLRYIGSLLKNSYFSDDILQLNSMLQIIANNLSNEEIVLENYDTSIKLLSKLFSISIQKNETDINEFDLSYDEIICEQITIVNRIEFEVSNPIVFVFIPLLTNRIKKVIDECFKIRFIVVFQKTNTVDLIDNIMINNFDFENDNQLYERMNDMSNIYNFDEWKEEMLREYLLFIK